MRPLFLLFLVAVASSSLWAQDQTSGALDRLDEALEPVIEDGVLTNISPLIFVSARPAFENDQLTYPNQALSFLVGAFGSATLRACEACMNPRVYARDGRLEHNSVLSIDEIRTQDKITRGKGAPAKAAIWLDQTPKGVSIRIVSLKNGAILFAGNFDEDQLEKKESSRTNNASVELDRRLRGESLTHVITDLGFYPNFRLSFDILEQFGKTNRNLAGITLSTFTPIVGAGGAYYRVFPEAWGLTVGGQVVVSVPSAIFRAFANSLDVDDSGLDDILDPILTGVLVARMPIPTTNFAGLLMVSTQGTVSVGVSFIKSSFLPVLP